MYAVPKPIVTLLVLTLYPLYMNKRIKSYVN